MTKSLLLLVALTACFDEADPPLRTGSSDPADVMREVNDHWIATHADPGNNKWARAVYFTGNMAAYDVLGDPAYREYAERWADNHGWSLEGGTSTRHADNHTAGQTYLALYRDHPDPVRIADISRSMSALVDSGDVGDWSWIDAMYMAEPVLAELGEMSGDDRYTRTMFAMYLDAKVRRGLFDEQAGLWFRDEHYLYPEVTTQSGKKVFWSRGNGWVIASLVRVLQHLPPESPYRAEYVAMLQMMATSIAAAQRPDGFWNVNLADADDYGGPEASGTALFVYAMAWGVREGVLDPVRFLPVIERGWDALVDHALLEGGGVGYVQGVGEAPQSAQPVELASTQDFGVGAVLLAGSEMHLLATE
ncbi:MAG TPA: glycoside hydrolase family 88 protein [Kofleriaceae bacterium]|nr:glycoside hydrolase family 88 protein [Kofleriaceae bacterium]